MNRLLRLLSVAIAMAFLAACGAKGPLFLPEKPLPPVEVPVNTVDEPATPASEGASDAPAPSSTPSEPAPPASTP